MQGLVLLYLMKYILIIIFALVLISGCYGFYLKSEDAILANKLIGFAVLGLFLVWMPLFVYHRFNGKDIKKYMITDDFFKKIKEEADTFIEKK